MPTNMFLYPRIERLHIRNYRVLRDVVLTNIQPFTVLIGANGSGKSTIIDAFTFIQDCFISGLKSAWEKRGGLHGIRSRNSSEPVWLEITFRLNVNDALMSYSLEITEDTNGNPFVRSENMGTPEMPSKKLKFQYGKGTLGTGQLINENLDSPDLLAVNVLGQLGRDPIISALRRFITNWHFVDFHVDEMQFMDTPNSKTPTLQSNGSNIVGVIDYWQKQESGAWQTVLNRMVQLVPQLEVIKVHRAFGRVELRLKDLPFDEEILARFASEGTLKLLAYLLTLYNPKVAPLITWEEPENHLHPSLLQHIAEDFRGTSATTQLFVTTHAPNFINGLRPEEVWMLGRGSDGYAVAKSAASMVGVKEFVDAGAMLGELWLEGQLEFRNPPTNGQLLSKRPH